MISSTLFRICMAGTLALAAPAIAQDAHIRVVDVGPGLCVVAQIPGKHAMVYDTGPGGGGCLAAVRELVPDKVIDLMVLSHSDIDHIRETQPILDETRVLTIIHPGDPRGVAVDAVRAAINSEGADVWSLASRPIPPGQRFALGNATATFVAGWSDGHQTEGSGEPPLSGGPLNNALSTVIRFEYGGHSVLLTGDTVGRVIDGPSGQCMYAERKMVENKVRAPIRSDVLIGQHHGADNATSNCFIAAVHPQFVVFSAGHKFGHPTQAAAERLFTTLGPAVQVFRTDRGDDERTTDHKREWIFGSLKNCTDEKGDDDVEIFLPSSRAAPVRVEYKMASNRC